MLDRIYRALAENRPGEPPSLSDLMSPLSPEAEALIGEERQAAAVLVGLRQADDGLNLLLTERSKELRAHPGQVSFPGGKVERQDTSHWNAALREAQEEIGLEPAAVRHVGYLPTYLTVTGFVVTPAVGLVPDAFEPRPDGIEVDEVFEVPLAFLFDPANITVTYRERLGCQFRVYEYAFEGHRIWGATAAMIVGMRDQVLGLAAPE